MEDFANVGRNYNPWKWWKFRRYAVQVVRHIGQLKDHQRDLAKQLDQWIHPRSPITAETVQTVRAQYQSDAELCTLSGPYRARFNHDPPDHPGHFSQQRVDNTHRLFLVIKPRQQQLECTALKIRRPLRRQDLGGVPEVR